MSSGYGSTNYGRDQQQFREQRRSLMGGRGGRNNNNNSSSGNTGQRVDTRALLKDSVRTADEAERISGAVIDEMQIQRAQLEGAAFQLDDMKNMTLSAQEALSDIANQDYRQRLCLWIVIAVLFVLNITVLVIMINNGGKLYKVGHTFGMGYHNRHANGQHNEVEYIDGTGNEGDSIFGKDKKGKHHHHHRFKGEDNIASAVGESGGFQLFNDLISGHSVEQHIGETGKYDDDDDKNDDGDDNDNSGDEGEKKDASTGNMMMKEGSDETYPHHSDDTVHDDQADQIQETVDSGAAAVAEGVVEAVDEAAGIKDVQHQEEIAVEEAHIGAK